MTASRSSLISAVHSAFHGWTDCAETGSDAWIRIWSLQRENSEPAGGAVAGASQGAGIL